MLSRTNTICHFYTPAKLIIIANIYFHIYLKETSNTYSKQFPLKTRSFHFRVQTAILCQLSLKIAMHNRQISKIVCKSNV